MTHRVWRIVLWALVSLPGAAQAQLFWYPPDFRGEPVRGDESGVGLPLPGATPAELDAYLLWNMRAGLNVAALQCQFAPMLMTVRNYNDLVKGQNAAEISSAYTTLNGYFKRVGGRAKRASQSQDAFDQFTTKTYNGFSTLHAQRGFCQTAGSIGREAIGRPKGTLVRTARERMREFRNSLVPRGDKVPAMTTITFADIPQPDPCWNYEKDKPQRCS